MLSVETDAAYASDRLRSGLDAVADAREAALATELVMGTLRWQRLLDFFAERYAGRKLSTLDPEVLIILRLGIYQLRFLARIPTRAAVSESVELTKFARKKSAAALVNAVLRRAATEKDRIVTDVLPSDAGTAEKLAIAHSHPTWMVERWLSRFGEEQTAALLETNNQTPPHACALGNSKREEAIRSLDEAGIRYEAGRLLRDAIIVARGNIAATNAFRAGWIGVQDEASQLVPLLLDVEDGNSILDLCAAPGGKTMILANLAGRTGRVVAADLHEKRVRAMRERVNEAGIENAWFVVLDGSASLPFRRKFDRILVDAPCSGTGTLARNPEIRWRLREHDLADLHGRQVGLVRTALEQLAPGGSLLYSTCSLEPEENESVVHEAVESSPAFQHERVRIPRDALAAGVCENNLVDDNGAFHTFPPAHHTDGFFAALIHGR